MRRRTMGLAWILWTGGCGLSHEREPDRFTDPETMTPEVTLDASLVPSPAPLPEPGPPPAPGPPPPEPPPSRPPRGEPSPAPASWNIFLCQMALDADPFATRTVLDAAKPILTEHGITYDEDVAPHDGLPPISIDGELVDLAMSPERDFCGTPLARYVTTSCGAMVHEIVVEAETRITTLFDWSVAASEPWYPWFGSVGIADVRLSLGVALERSGACQFDAAGAAFAWGFEDGRALALNLRSDDLDVCSDARMLLASTRAIRSEDHEPPFDHECAASVAGYAVALGSYQDGLDEALYWFGPAGPSELHACECGD